MVCSQREHDPVFPRSFHADSNRATVPDLAAPAVDRGRGRLRPALIFRHGRGKHGADRSGRPRTIDATSLFCFQRAALCLQADCVERKEEIMVRSFGSWPRPRSRPRSLRLGRERPGRAVQEGPMETGPLRPGLRGRAAEGEAAPDGAEEARKACRAGRPADHRPCPAVLPDRRHAGSRRHGRQRLRLRHFQPADADRGDLLGHARPGEAHRPVRQRRARADPVQVLSWRELQTIRPRGNSASTATSNPGGSSRATPLRQHPRLDRVALRRACGEWRRAARDRE